MSSVRFGTGLPANQQIPSRVRPWEKAVGGAEMLAAARAAEAAGFDWLACSDHVCVPVSRAQVMGPTWYDAGSALAFVAGVTSRIRLLSHVLVVPYRHPLIVAKQYVAIKDYSSLSYSKIERKKVSAWGRVGILIFLTVILIGLTVMGWFGMTVPGM